MTDDRAVFTLTMSPSLSIANSFVSNPHISVPQYHPKLNVSNNKPQYKDVKLKTYGVYMIPLTDDINQIDEKNNITATTNTATTTTTTTTTNNNNNNIKNNTTANNKKITEVSYMLTKSRSYRRNPAFLRIYANEYTAICKDLIPNFLSEEFFQLMESNKKIVHKDNKLALLAYNKLWKLMKLPPRTDLPINKNNTFYQNSYVYIGDDQNQSNKDTTMTNETNQTNQSNKLDKSDKFNFFGTSGNLPWIKYNDEFRKLFFKNKSISAINEKNLEKTKIQLNEKTLDNLNKNFKPCGTLKNNVQFTVKGWANPRWISANNSD
ncbi:uncharacterized protein ASCRUDRAFT_68073 [Ascoidea rubescens DSM 1968]|uniref:Uncharacterized protein n=1 Tax=Ascoidea rubescens DSM 1968 TaxID=1344418 RepID=A0A1D2VR03_9ASCO|nr:hypothetical protein ASCRUDRAFT_68073 [Ascoidea rubescens DSM 1968]ODV64034.1 hypothetical protein ASCRUDRAFT_68073 [Ascoidea rubescens DSM 1968]